MRLAYQRDPVSHLTGREPRVRHRETKPVHTTSVIQDGRQQEPTRNLIEGNPGFAESARGAVPGLLLARLPVPLAE